jgi:CheY-like chemotaxis protein
MGSKPAYRVMVVDDDADIRLVIESVLEDAYEVVHAHDGLEALEKIENIEPDLVIMDIVMPLMDGMEACRAIRRIPRFANLQVMFLSGHNTPENIKGSYESGGSIFLVKPIEPERLRKNVDVYFQTAGTPPRPKKMSLHQLQIITKGGEQHPAPAAAGQPSRGAAPTQTPTRPSTRAIPPARPPAPKPRPSSDQQPRVLVVEDSEDIAEIINLGLSDSYEVVIAQDGLEAAEKVARFQPDILVIDVMLPKMSGYQLCQSVRANASFADAPIIFVTAKASPKDREHAMRLGASAFLPKPFEIDELVRLCQGFAAQPSFRIRRKILSLPEIRAIEREEKRAKEQRRGAFDRLGKPRT